MVHANLFVSVMFVSLVHFCLVSCSRLKNNLISFVCLVASGHVAFILLGLAVLQQYIIFLSSNGISQGKKIRILLTLVKCYTVACVLSFPNYRELFLYRAEYGREVGHHWLLCN